MQYNRLEKITVNDSRQWVLVRGKSADAPLLIQVQAGPGLPMIPEAGIMEKQLHLENNFLVAYCDQRATKFSTPDVARCCFSLKSIKPNSIPLSS